MAWRIAVYDGRIFGKMEGVALIHAETVEDEHVARWKGGQFAALGMPDEILNKCDLYHNFLTKPCPAQLLINIVEVSPIT